MLTIQTQDPVTADFSTQPQMQKCMVAKMLRFVPEVLDRDMICFDHTNLGDTILIMLSVIEINPDIQSIRYFMAEHDQILFGYRLLATYS